MKYQDSWFAHLAMEIPGVDTSNEWLEPVFDGVPDTPAVFERRADIPFDGPVSFRLKSAEPAKDGCVWLCYLAKDKK